MRDLRNESREWPGVGLQALIDMRLNGFGLELFVESYWDTLALLLEMPPGPEEFRQLVDPLVVEYRGMVITLDPRPGLRAGGILPEGIG